MNKRMKKKLLWTSLTMATLSTSVNANLYRMESQTLVKKAKEFIVGGSYWKSSALLDIDGVEQQYTEGSAYSYMDGFVQMNYGFSDRLELGAGLRARSVSSDVINEDTKSDSGPESGFGFIKYSFTPKSKWTYAGSVFLEQTFYTNNDYTATETIPSDEIILGDSGTTYGFNVSIGRDFSKTHKVFFTGGYRQPGNSLSPELTYKIETAWPYVKWAFYGGLRGIKSMNGDEFTDSVASKPRQATGSTLLWNSVNREKMEGYLGLNYAFSKTLTASVVGSQVFSGVSTDMGNKVLISLNWGSKGVSKDTRRVNKFKEYIIESDVIKVSPRGKFIKIDKGLAHDVEKGMKFDIFKTDFFGGNVLSATGTVYEVGSDWAIIKVLKRSPKHKVKAGFSARGY
jgi:hypothetical protein